MSEQGGGGHALRAVLVGVSESSTCGVRDHAVLLAEALRAEGVSCKLHWLWRSQRSFPAARAEFAGWTRTVAAQLAVERPDAIVLQYSVFSYSYRGLPVFVRPTLAALGSAAVPIVSILHEFVYPWQRPGLRAKAWALTQALVLRGVVGSSAGLVVTAPARADWLAARAWLARRPIALAPVFSNLPPPSAGAPRPEELVAGLFGWAYEGAASTLVLDALPRLHERGLDVRLRLLGAPGPGTAAAEAWLAAARSRGVEDAITFSGVLPAAELSDALAACTVLIHPEPSGPTSRKGTLAASLASGRPVVAVDGPRRWRELITADAALVVAASAAALADGVADLLLDARRREALGARGAGFAREAMGVQRSARAVADMLRELPGAPSPPTADAGVQPVAGAG